MHAFTYKITRVDYWDTLHSGYHELPFSILPDTHFSHHIHAISASRTAFTADEYHKCRMPPTSPLLRQIQWRRCTYINYARVEIGAWMTLMSDIAFDTASQYQIHWHMHVIIYSSFICRFDIEFHYIWLLELYIWYIFVTVSSLLHWETDRYIEMPT